MTERVNKPNPEDQPKHVGDISKQNPLGDLPSFIPATNLADLQKEYQYFQGVIYPPAPGRALDATHPPDSELAKIIQQLTQDAKNIANEFPPNSSEHALLDFLIGSFSKASADIMNNRTGGPGGTLDMFNKTFSNLQNDINNLYNYAASRGKPSPFPYPELLPKSAAQGQLAAKTKAFGEKPLEKLTHATNPEELLMQYTEMKNEMRHYDPISGHPHLKQLTKQLVSDAHRVAEKFPHSGRLDQMQALTETFHDAAKELQNHPQDSKKQDIFKKTFANLYTEIQNWAEDKQKPYPHPDQLP